MLKNKYAKDYRIEAYSGKNGKVKERAVYTGPVFELDQESNGHLFRKMALLFIISLLLVITSLWNYSTLTRVFYFSGPLLLMPVVLYLYLTWLLHVRGENGRLNREQKEKGPDRLKGIGIFGIVISGIVFVTALIKACLNGMDLLFWDWYFLAASALQIPVYTVSFLLGRKITVTEDINRKTV